MKKNRAKLYQKLIVGSLLAAILSLGAFKVSEALYSDYEYIPPSLIGTASLDLLVTGEDPTTLAFSVPALAPGAPHRQIITFTDQSSLLGVKNIYWDVVVTESSEGENLSGETDTEGKGELDECATIEFSYTSPNTGEKVLVYSPVTFNSMTGFYFDLQANSSLDGFVANEPLDLHLDFNADDCGPEAMGDNFKMEMNIFYDQF